MFGITKAPQFSPTCHSCPYMPLYALGTFGCATAELPYHKTDPRRNHGSLLPINMWVCLKIGYLEYNID